MIDRLRDWFLCIEALTPDPGIYSGFLKDGELMDFRHAEGSIDVYGALADLDAELARSSIKSWLDEQVWIPREECFERGPDNRANLPTDHVSWGFLALGPDYSCILAEADS